MTHDEFYCIFRVMSEYYGAHPSNSLMEIYWQAFKSWTTEDFQKACNAVMFTKKFRDQRQPLPLIPEIIEAVFGKPEDRAALAYHTLVEAMRRIGSWETVIFEDGAIGQAIDAMGGWEYVNGITIEEWKFRRRDFESLYLAHTNRGDNEPVTCPGAFDKINGTTGYEGRNKPILVTRDRKFLEYEKPKTSPRLLMVKNANA